MDERVSLSSGLRKRPEYQLNGLQHGWFCLDYWPRERKYDAMSPSVNSAPLENFIDGQWSRPAAGRYLQNFRPSTGMPANMIADSGEQDVKMAVEAAERAFGKWSQVTPRERSHYLLKLAEGIEARFDEFANVESLDQGKPLWLTKEMDIPRAVQNFRFFAEFILKEDSESYELEKFRTSVHRRPVGVAGLISPWNLPLYLLTWKVAPALAFGNTVVCKPSELTSLTAGLLAEVAASISLPPGVLNFVFGRGAEAGEALVKHPRVPLISFTGGTATGRRIYRESAEHFKKISLELGGKNPNLIFADSDLKKAVLGTVRSSFLNQGEICLCGSRIYVEEKIYDQFLELFIEEVKKIKVGDPAKPDSFMGALVSRGHLEKVESYIQIAREEGGKILVGGDRPRMSPELSEGYYLNPTVITGLGENSRCIQEEIFGPVVTVSKFKDEKDAIEKANGVNYGLSATIWSEDKARAKNVAEQLNVGTVWINSWLLRDLRVPFGGMKHSGIGREGGHYSREFFTEPTSIIEVKL